MSESEIGRYRSAAPDIDVAPPDGAYPISRGAAERAIQRVDRYNRRAELVSYEELTSTGTVLITFKVIDDQAFNFKPGYFIGITADVPGVGPRRSPYCITSPPNDERTFRLLVRLVPEGPLSIYLSSLGPGDVIAFRGPAGRSMVPHSDDAELDLVLLATGVGVGPFLGLLEVLKDQGFERSIRLYWGLRLVEDLCFRCELDQLVAALPNFQYHVSLSQPPDDWTGLRGRLTETVPPLIDSLSGKKYYLVGNGAMIDEISTALSDLGVDREFIHEEVYFNSRYRADPGLVAEIRDRFVARDLFSPHAHLSAGLFIPESTSQRS
jgi:ferredoxin-NADP reductase